MNFKDENGDTWYLHKISGPYMWPVQAKDIGRLIAGLDDDSRREVNQASMEKSGPWILVGLSGEAEGYREMAGKLAKMETELEEARRLLSIAVAERRQAEAESAFSNGKPIDRGVFLKARMAYLAHMREEGEPYGDMVKACNLQDEFHVRRLLLTWEEQSARRAAEAGE